MQREADSSQSEAGRSAVEVSRPVRFLFDPAAVQPAAALVVALHGYGLDAASMLDWTRKLLGDGPAIVAIEAPNAARLGSSAHAQKTGYNWGIVETTEFHVGFHHRIVQNVLEWAWQHYSIPAGRTILAGFSQPVGLNYRFAAAHPGLLRGVLALCGGVPEDWDKGAHRPLPLSVLHVARHADEFYPPETMDLFESRLRRSVEDVTLLRLPGGHRFPMRAQAPVRAWLARITA